MGTAENIGGLLGGFNQTFWPLYMQKIKKQQEEQQQRKELNQKFAYDASLGKLVPINTQLNMLPGLGGQTTGNVSGYSGFPQVNQPRNISPLQLGGGISPSQYMSQPETPGSTYILPGAGVPGGRYMPRPQAPEVPGEYKPTTEEAWQRGERFKAGLKPATAKEAKPDFTDQELNRLFEMASDKATDFGEKYQWDDRKIADMKETYYKRFKARRLLENNRMSYSDKAIDIFLRDNPDF